MPPWDETAINVYREVLRDFADTWIACGFNVRKWSRREKLQEALRNRDVILKPGSPPTVYFETAWSEDPAGHGLAYGAWLFFKFVTSPSFDLLGQCVKCGRYFVGKRKRLVRKYCSGKCGRAATAKKAVRDKHGKERSVKLDACRRAITSFLQKSPAFRERLQPGWKQWTAANATKLLLPGKYPCTVTPTFITREINSGRLNVPLALRNA